MRTQLQRDPFTRATLMRDPAQPGPCGECGRQGRRWRYQWESDGRAPLRVTAISFCSVGCFRAYWY